MKGLQEMTIKAVLKRVETGMSDFEDAEQIREWLVGDTRRNIVKAYLLLTRNISDVRRFIAEDLREGLAELLIGKNPRNKIVDVLPD